LNSLFKQLPKIANHLLAGTTDIANFTKIFQTTYIMKKTTLLCITVMVLAFSTNLGAQQLCNHKHAFSRSVVADSLEALHYRIHLQNINFTERTVKAVTELSLVPKLPLEYIPLELKALQVDSVYFNGIKTDLFYQQGDVMRASDGQVYTQDDTLLLAVYYSGTPFNEAWGGFHFSGNYAFNLGVGFESNPHNLGKAWFPCVDDFKDRATYEVLITLPDGMTGIAGGLLIETIDNGDGTNTWHWHLAQPIPTYLASFAAGDYRLSADVYEGIEANIPITVYTRPADTNKVAGSFVHIHEIMQDFEQKFTPYPWERIGYTGTAIGAMEHVTNIAYPHFAINGNLQYEELLVHELSHMWFGNKVTCATEGDMWLNEGWATFISMYYKTQLYGYEEYRNAMRENHFSVIRDAHIQDGSYLPLSGVPTEYVYGKTVYNKGATVVHTLMNYLGEEVFLDAVKAYLNHFAYNHASSEDMRDFLSAHTGIDMTPFFEAWVFTPGTPHFSIDSARVVPQGAQYEAHVYLRQKFKGFDFLADNNILEIAFIDANWQIHTDTVHFNGQTGHSVKLLDFEPLLVMADYFDKTCDATTDEDYVYTETGESIHSKLYFKLFIDALPDSMFMRMTHHWAPADPMHQPLNGLTLSPYRYWEFAGIIPEGTAMRGRFFYSNQPILDQTLITSPTDSVFILYRPHPGVDWYPVSQYKQGNWNIGFIFVDELLPGQYTLAVWDTQVGLNENLPPAESGAIRLTPNPATNVITASWEQIDIESLRVYNAMGKLVHQEQVHGSKSISLEISGWASGIYMIELGRLDGSSVASGKFIAK
jgi:hypothetical protein